MLTLRFLQLLLAFFKLHSEELNLLISHGDVFLRVVSHLHLTLIALLHFAFQFLNVRLHRLDLGFTLFKLMVEKTFVLLLLLALVGLVLFQHVLTVSKLGSQSFLDLGMAAFSIL